MNFVPTTGTSKSMHMLGGSEGGISMFTMSAVRRRIESGSLLIAFCAVRTIHQVPAPKKPQHSSTTTPQPIPNPNSNLVAPLIPGRLYSGGS